MNLTPVPNAEAYYVWRGDSIVGMVWKYRNHWIPRLMGETRIRHRALCSTRKEAAEALLAMVSSGG